MWSQRRCPGCGASGWSPCPSCVRLLRAAPRLAVPGARRASALIEFSGVGRDLVHSLKFGGARDLAGWFGEAMAVTIATDVDVVTWVPTTRQRRRERGYDQAQLLARSVGRAAQVPTRRLLHRRGSTVPQTGRTALERMAGPSYQTAGSMTGVGVFLVDDVVTTGASATAAVTGLISAGARFVDIGFVARTPLPARPVGEATPC